MARALTNYDLFYSYVPSALRNCLYFLKDGFLLCHPLYNMKCRCCKTGADKTQDYSTICEFTKKMRETLDLGQQKGPINTLEENNKSFKKNYTILI